MTIRWFQIPLDRDQSDEVFALLRSCRVIHLCNTPAFGDPLTLKCMLSEHLHARIVTGLATDRAYAYLRNQGSQQMFAINGPFYVTNIEDMTTKDGVQQ